MPAVVAPVAGEGSLAAAARRARRRWRSRRTRWRPRRTERSFYRESRPAFRQHDPGPGVLYGAKLRVRRAAVLAQWPGTGQEFVRQQPLRPEYRRTGDHSQVVRSQQDSEFHRELQRNSCRGIPTTPRPPCPARRSAAATSRDETRFTIPLRASPAWAASHLPDNQIPLTRISPIAQGLLQYVPLPIYSGLIQNYRYTTSIPTNSQSVNTRIQWTVDQTNRISFSSNYANPQRAEQHALRIPG